MLLPTYKGFTLGYAFKCALASSLIEILYVALIIYSVCKNRKRSDESTDGQQDTSREIAKANTGTAAPYEQGQAATHVETRVYGWEEETIKHTDTAAPYGQGPAAAYVETGVHVREEATIEHNEHGTVVTFVSRFSMYQIIHSITGRGHD